MIDYIPSHIKSLDKEHLHLLCFWAYVGEDYLSKPSADVMYRRHFGVKKTEYEERLYHLKESHYLVSSSVVASAIYMAVLAWLHTEHTDWLSEFRSIKLSRTSTAQYLEYITTCCLHGEFQKAAAKPRPYEGFCPQAINLYPYLKEIILKDFRFLSILKREELSQSISLLLKEQFEQEQLDVITLEQLRRFIPTHIGNYTNLISEIEAYNYFITGKLCGTPKYSRTNAWWMVISAISHLYHGNLEEALNCFADALKQHKNPVWQSPIICLYYTIALLLASHNKATKNVNEKITSFRYNNSELRTSPFNFFARLLLDFQYESDDMQDVVKTAISNAIKEHDCPLMQRLAWLAARYFGIANADIELSNQFSTSLLLQYEQSRYLPILDNSKTEMAEQIGGSPVLSRLRRRKEWEKMLNEMSANVIAFSEKRLIYCFENGALTAIIEQTSQKDGQWEDGQLQSLSNLATIGSDSMTVEDHMAITALYNGHNLLSDIQIAFPYLVHSGRIFIGNCYSKDRTPITVVEDKPFLHFNVRGTNIEVESNVSLVDDHIEKYYVNNIGDNTYSMITIGPLQRDIICRLLTQKTFPLAANVSLLATIKSIQGVIDVQEDISLHISNDVEISDGRIAIRISPDNNDFVVTILSAPFSNGSVRLKLSDRESFIYDTVDGYSQCIKRNQIVEKSNFEHLRNHLLDKVEWQQDDKCRIHSIEVLLDLLSFAKEHRYILEWPEGHTIRLITLKSSCALELNLRTAPDWFELEGALTTPLGPMEIQDLLDRYSKDKYEDYIRLSNDEYLRLTDKLKKQIKLLEAVISPKSRRIPFYHVGALAKLIDEINTNVDDKYEEFLLHTQQIFQQNEPLPEGLRTNLYPYQIQGYQWICRMDAWGAGVCLADDMGLGKTIQSLAFLLHKAQSGPSLVVCPKSVILNWSKEMIQHTPDLHPIVLNDESNRSSCLVSLTAGDVVICTYGVLCTERARLCKIDWNVACLDEAHLIKNHYTQASDAAMHIKAKSRIVLTGTPVQNHLGELWNLFQFINPGMLGNWLSFKSHFLHTDLQQYEIDILHEMTQPFILRRTKEEVLRELPEKQVNIYMVNMTEEETSVYEQMRAMAEVKFKTYKTTPERNLVKQVKMDYFAELTKLRLASCSMRLIQPKWASPSSKITALLEMLDTLLSQKENRIVIFSQFTRFLALIKPELQNRGINFLYLDGQTEHKKRQQLITEFQSGDCQVFLCSLKAGGVGVNLTAANYVILLDPWWNPAIESQAMDRTHRIGQSRAVSVIRMITARTVEEKLLALHEQKQSLANEILSETNQTHQLTYDDIIDMVVPFQ